jgi:hypothetical protein
MPDDKEWTPAKMPVIQSVSANNSADQFPHAVGVLVGGNNVTIRGLKFLGNPNPTVKYYKSRHGQAGREEWRCPADGISPPDPGVGRLRARGRNFPKQSNPVKEMPGLF